MKKKILILAGVVALFGLAVFINYRLTADTAAEEIRLPAEPAEPERQAAADTDEDYFAVFRQERDSVRSREIEYLETIIQQAGLDTDAETIAEAQRQKMDIVDNMEKEFTVESLLKAKGFQDAAVTLHQGSVNVILCAKELTQAQVAQVLDIVLRETGKNAENVKVLTME